MFSVCGYANKGFQSRTLPQLRKVEVTPRGERSERWQGIQHGELVKSLHGVLKDLFGVVPMNEQYLLSPNDAIMVGGFELGTETKGKKGTTIKPVEPFPGIGTSVGFIHANDSSKALRVLAGGRVFLCSNGAVVGEVKFQRKHTTGLYLHDWLLDNLSDFLPNVTLSLQNQMAPLSGELMTPSKHDAALLALGRQGILPWKMLEDADKLWQNAVQGKSIDWVPEDDQDKWGFGTNKWDAYGAFSHIAKQLPAMTQLRALERGLALYTSL